jgi:hypothetical protein
LRVVVDWAEPRRDALADAWNAVMAKRKPEKIA